MREPDTDDLRDKPLMNAWQEAIDFGIDVALIEENLRRTPAERLATLVAMQRLFELLHPDHRAPLVPSDGG